jgi:hypothetical protein
VVNVDNGFGAAVATARIMRATRESSGGKALQDSEMTAVVSDRLRGPRG